MKKAIVRELFGKYLVLVGTKHPRYGLTKLDVVRNFNTKEEAQKEATRFNLKEDAKERTTKCHAGL